MNSFLTDGKVEEKVLDKIFDALWPSLTDAVTAALEVSIITSSTSYFKTSENSKILGALDELMATTRSLSQIVSDPERLLPRKYLDFAFSRTRMHVGRNLSSDQSEVGFTVRRAHDICHALMGAKTDDEKDRHLRALHRCILDLESLVGARRSRPKSLTVRDDDLEPSPSNNEGIVNPDDKTE